MSTQERPSQSKSRGQEPPPASQPEKPGAFTMSLQLPEAQQYALRGNLYILTSQTEQEVLGHLNPDQLAGVEELRRETLALARHLHVTFHPLEALNTGLIEAIPQEQWDQWNQPDALATHHQWMRNKVNHFTQKRQSSSKTGF